MEFVERGVSLVDWRVMSLPRGCVFVLLRSLTRNKKCVHARRGLWGLEHFGYVLFRQRRLPSALSLDVLLLPPLEVLEEGTERGRAGIRGDGLQMMEEKKR